MSVAVAAGVMVAPAQAEKQTWKVHSSFSTSTPIDGPALQRLVDNTALFSGGDFKVKVFEPNALVPATQYWEAVSTGAIDAAFGTPGYSQGVEPALVMFSAVPFGPQVPEYLSWLMYGGGKKFYDEILAKHNMVGFFCSVKSAESGGWYPEPVGSFDELKGKKFRMFGLGGKVLNEFGISAQLIPGGELYAAFERGTVDAGEYSMPAVDEKQGFQRIMKHLYFPAWQQQASLNDLLINKDAWDKLTPAQQASIKMTCDQNLTLTLAEGESLQGPAMVRLRENDGVTFHRWPYDELAKLQEVWEDKVIQEEVKSSPTFKKVWEHYSAYREAYKDWGQNAFIY
ncbi:TRAP transporter substrate-binding protein [Parasalinivibrio latis]|uniref:TRAP transporter substrate-binding protein n=1 Tax=Parasalinivibrio latis TaxID=2952610 RepID=UPI0030E149BF